MSREVVEKRTLDGLGSEGRKSVTAASRPKVLKVTSRLWRLTPFTAHAVPLPLQAGGGKFLEVTPLPMNGKGKGGDYVLTSPPNTIILSRRRRISVRIVSDKNINK